LTELATGSYLGFGFSAQAEAQYAWQRALWQALSAQAGRFRLAGMLTRALQKWRDDNRKLLIVFRYLSVADLSVVDLGAVGGPCDEPPTRVLPQLPQLQ
jgi:hypothetical protein